MAPTQVCTWLLFCEQLGGSVKDDERAAKEARKVSHPLARGFLFSLPFWRVGMAAADCRLLPYACSARLLLGSLCLGSVLLCLGWCFLALQITVCRWHSHGRYDTTYMSPVSASSVVASRQAICNTLSHRV